VNRIKSTCAIIIACAALLTATRVRASSITIPASPAPDRFANRIPHLIHFAPLSPSPGNPAFGSEAQARRGEGWGEGLQNLSLQKQLPEPQRYISDQPIAFSKTSSILIFDNFSAIVDPTITVSDNRTVNIEDFSAYALLSAPAISAPLPPALWPTTIALVALAASKRSRRPANVKARWS
jgi:hypothetical protein